MLVPFHLPMPCRAACSHQPSLFRSGHLRAPLLKASLCTPSLLSSSRSTFAGVVSSQPDLGGPQLSHFVPTGSELDIWFLRNIAVERHPAAVRKQERRDCGGQQQDLDWHHQERHQKVRTSSTEAGPCVKPHCVHA